MAVGSWQLLEKEEMASSNNGFRDLIVWQKAMELVLTVCRMTASFPGEGRFGLTSQIRRAAVSVPSNIAEGQARMTRGEFLQFLGHARGSLAELETQLLLARDLKLLTEPGDSLDRIAEVGRLLNGLISSLRTKD